MASASDATEWNQLSTRYFLEAALQAARNSNLYLVALDCAARHPAAIGRLAQSPDDGAATRAALHAEAMFSSCSRFVAELARMAAGADGPAPQLRGSDVGSWAAQLANYMSGNGLAAPEQPGTASASQKVLRFGRAYFELLSAMTRIGADAEEQELRHMLARLELLKHPPPMIRLRAAPGDTTTTALRVQNTRAERAVVSCRVPMMRSANGVGAAFAPAIRIEPDDFALDPGAEADVQLTLDVDATTFMSDSSYVGEVHLRRGDESEVRIPLRLDTGTLK